MGRNEAVDIQRADVEKVIRFGGELLLTSHLFFGDFDEKPIATIRDGGVVFFCREAMERRDARLAELRRGAPPVIGEEVRFECEVVATLKNRGRKVSRQVRTPFGRLDILVEDRPVEIIEVKAFADTESLFKAVGQLVLYGDAYPGALLSIACRYPIPPKIAAALEKRGIREWK